MPKPDKMVAEIGAFTIFRKSDSQEYEIVGPAVQNSPLAYTMVRTTPDRLAKILSIVRLDARNSK
jgi:hypothetical protein